MPKLLSCCDCKRAVLMTDHITGTEMVQLQRHLAACRPDDLRIEDPLRHFRTVTIELAGEPADTARRVA